MRRFVRQGVHNQFNISFLYWCVTGAFFTVDTFEFFTEITFAAAFHFWPITVVAKVFANIVFVPLVKANNEKLSSTLSHQADSQQQCNTLANIMCLQLHRILPVIELFMGK